MDRMLHGLVSSNMTISFLGFRRLGSLESSCEQITEKLSDLEDAGLERDKDLKSRLGELGAATRELQRGVQLLRDRQARQTAWHNCFGYEQLLLLCMQVVLSHASCVFAGDC